MKICNKYITVDFMPGEKNLRLHFTGAGIRNQELRHGEVQVQ